MATRKQYYGLDVVKFFLAVLVAERHVVQIYFDASSKWRILLNNWLSNLAVPVFFTIAGFFLFQKLEAGKFEENKKQVFRYCGRIIWMYVIWSILYLPTDIKNWISDGDVTKVEVAGWFQSFLFCSTIPQLWYLPALALACLVVWLLWEKGMKIRQILAVGVILLLCGYLSDNWYFNCRFPQFLQEIVIFYRKIFITPRNGIFYGMFYIALGLMFAKTTWRLPTWCASIGTGFFLWCMYSEVMRITDAGSNTNFVLFAVPAAYCLFTAASAVEWKPRRLYPRLRGMSEWVYLSHFYFFYILGWTQKWNPIPFNSRSVSVMILGAVLAFSMTMVLWSERESGKWLKKLI
ncbi:MAG: acyltransferase family protein [Brotaphodocola sp.]